MTGLLRRDGRSESPRLIARDIWCTLRQEGRHAAVAAIGHIARRRVYAKVDEVVLGRRLVEAPPMPARSALRIEVAEPRHLPALADFHRRRCMNRRTEVYAAAISEGVRAILGFVDEELIGYMWWVDGAQAAKGSYLTRFGVALAPDEVFGYNLFIAPEHRGGGMAGAFLDRVEAELARQGYRRIVGTVDTRNVPARWMHETRGYEVLRRCTTRIVLHALVIVDGRPHLAWRGGLRPLGPAARRGARADGRILQPDGPTVPPAGSPMEATLVVEASGSHARPDRPGDVAHGVGEREP